MCRRVAARTNPMVYVAWGEQQQLTEIDADSMLGGMCFHPSTRGSVRGWKFPPPKGYNGTVSQYTHLGIFHKLCHVNT